MCERERRERGERESERGKSQETMAYRLSKMEAAIKRQKKVLDIDR